MLLEIVNSVFKGVGRSGRQKTKGKQSQALQEYTDNLNRLLSQAEAPVHEYAVNSPFQQLHVAWTGAQNTTTQRSGFFNNARGITIRDPIMTEAEVINNYITNHIDNGKALLDRLLPHTAPEAAMDSQARYPPPLCHPGTRRGIGTKLETWLDDEHRQWKMVWLHGPAGVGKSAVAQTFAEYCANEERNRLGAAFFFSGSNHRNEPNRVIPTLAYQLAIHCRDYRDLLADQLVNNPAILNATMRVQFRKFIIDPFSELQARGSPSVRCPYTVILDGLDECNGEDAQCEIIELINEVIRRKDLPILWLVCSRPEPHLKYTFSKADFSINCGREELVINDDARQEVDRYLRDGFKDIQARFSYYPNGPWPSEEQFEGVSQVASGLFIVASTALKYVGDSGYANPAARLDGFLSFMKDSHSVGVKSPLEALDLLYTRILLDVPSDVLPVTRQILSHQLYLPRLVNSTGRSFSPSAQTLSNLLHLDQSAFYGALRKLHSVINIPPSEEASETSMGFFHASFGDYLRNPIRSGKFVIEEKKALTEIAKSCLYWHRIDSTLYHTDDDEFERNPYRPHNHAPLPNLKWVTDDNAQDVSTTIAYLAQSLPWMACAGSDKNDQGLISQIHNFDFRYIEYPYDDFINFVNWLREVSSDSSNIVRTVPHDAIDEILMGYLKLMTDGELVKPATFPLNLHFLDGGWEREYFLLGHGIGTCIMCLAKARYAGQRLYILNSDKPPSEAQITRHRKWVAAAREDRYEGSDSDADSVVSDSDVDGAAGVAVAIDRLPLSQEGQN